MTQLTEKMYQIFDQPEFSFKKIKENHTPEEVDQLKEQFKEVWQIWKKVNQNVAKKLPEGLFAKVHVESWTNGWNLRDHYWAAYRLKEWENYNPCIGVMLDQKQLQVYLMFQHYKSNQREGSLVRYNQLLKQVPAWSKDLNLNSWYLWDKDDMELADHLPLKQYLTDENAKADFDQKASDTSFLVGKFAFRNQDEVEDMESFILSAIKELLPLYQKF